MKSYLKVWRVRPQISTELLTLLSCCYFLLCLNTTFWQGALSDKSLFTLNGWIFMAGVYVMLVGMHFLLLCPVMNRWTIKPILIVLVLGSACASFYSSRYKVYLNPEMIRNVIHTDSAEAKELLSPDFLRFVLLYSLPGAAIALLRIKAFSWPRATLRRLGAVLLALIVTISAGWMVFKDFSVLMRNQTQLRYLITPGNFIVSLADVLLNRQELFKQERKPIGLDAKLSGEQRQLEKPVLFILVVGETARAANWGLNGYVRQTTPELAKRNVINFKDVTSCGTSTEVSLPCMFSAIGRRNYNETEIRQQESLLHIAQRAGYQVLWRDNQSGCKGVCQGLQQQRMADLTDPLDPLLCDSERCLDELLLKNLDQVVQAKHTHQFIVLHQLGNHGPAYFKRYPSAFKRFTPTCNTVELSRCNAQEITNSYDNALLYTDHFLAQTIDFLKRQTNFYTALLYVSDHGESLGENGLFLHGIPYPLAPREQTRVPMIFWASDDYAQARGIDMLCLKKQAQKAVSHDYLFHSSLQLLGIETSLYQAQLDFLAVCR